MKKIKINLRGAPVVILVEVVVSVVISAALIGGVIFPGYNSWIATSAENKTARDKLANIERNIQEISLVDNDQADSLKSFLDSYLPSSLDAVPLFVLLENLATSTGVTISVGQLEANSGLVVPATGQVPTAPPAQTAAVGFNLRITVDGEYPKIESFLDGLKTINRAVGITSASVNSTSTSGGASLSLALKIPLSGPPPTSSAEVLISLSKDELSELQAIADKIAITASPSDDSVGRSSPF
jgi:type II secretory pathway pseudopilin PulG